MQAISINKINNENMWYGHRITGAQGTKTVRALTELLDLEQINKVNSFLKSNYHSYMPWMSSYDQTHLAEMKLFIQNEKILTNINELEKRKKILSSGDSKDLKRIYPACNGKMSISINPKELDIFRREINKCINLITSLNDNWKIREEILVSEYILREPNCSTYITREHGTGLTTHLYRKAMFLTLPTKSNEAQLELLLNIVHEMGHLALTTYQNYDSIIAKDIEMPLYSVIRKTKRPGILAFHAMIATVYMLEFLIDLKESNIEIITSKEYINKRAKRLIKSLKDALNIFKNVELTKLGTEIFHESYGIFALAQLKL